MTGIVITDIETAIFEYIEKGNVLMEQNLNNATKVYVLQFQESILRVLMTSEEVYLIE